MLPGTPARVDREPAGAPGKLDALLRRAPIGFLTEAGEHPADSDPQRERARHGGFSQSRKARHPRRDHGSSERKREHIHQVEANTKSTLTLLAPVKFRPP
jgi:hypothetical protein